MSDFTVIGVTGGILKKLLQDKISESFVGNYNWDDAVSLLSPKDMEVATPNHISIFLYHIIENGYMKNQPIVRNGARLVNYPPLSLNLYYLLTPYVITTQNNSESLGVHTLLGRAMQAFYDNAILEGTALLDALPAGQKDYYENIEELKITLNPVSLDDLTKLWGSLDTPMRLSVCYEVRVIMIDSKRTKETKRVAEKKAHYQQIK